MHVDQTTKTRVREDDIGWLVEKLAPNANVWKEIGGKLGFKRGELDNIENPVGQKPHKYLSTMLNDWSHWTPGTSHKKYAWLEDLLGALHIYGVNLGDLAEEIKQEWPNRCVHNVLHV